MAQQNIKAINRTPIWKLAVRFMVSFGFILTIVLFAAQLFKNGNLDAVSESFKDGSWFSYVGLRLAIIIAYGFIMAFLTKSKAKNKV